MTRQPLRVLLALATALAAAAVLTPHLHRPQPVGEEGAVVVTAVLDGDTLRAQDLNGDDLGRVRLLGVDAPELARDGRPAQCWAEEASAALHEATPVGARITLQRDPTQPDRDSYGRLLRYVARHGVDVQRDLLRAGAARSRASSPALQRQHVYTVAAGDAQQARRGLWSGCGR
ncbi:Thermonuclease (fragment) [Nostocoides japonicum T1-X7]|uniref:Thermonuclease n=1 Tax=Nostocoides japonicum T1-X7 TaxID=1194083 RepID=A0A077M8M9_9MICO